MCPPALAPVQLARGGRLAERLATGRRIDQDLAKTAVGVTFQDRAGDDVDLILEQFFRRLPGQVNEDKNVELLIDVGIGENDEDDSSHIWKPEYEDTDLKAVFTDAVLDAVILDSGCPLTLDCEQRSVIVRGFAYLTAARKLSNIERNAVGP